MSNCTRYQIVPSLKVLSPRHPIFFTRVGGRTRLCWVCSHGLLIYIPIHKDDDTLEDYSVLSMSYSTLVDILVFRPNDTLTRAGGFFSSSRGSPQLPATRNLFNDESYGHRRLVMLTRFELVSRD